jgi:hypothetical protein
MKISCMCTFKARVFLKQGICSAEYFLTQKASRAVFFKYLFEGSWLGAHCTVENMQISLTLLLICRF